MRPPPLLVGLLFLAGCTGMVRTMAYPFPQPAMAARVILQDAGATGPVLVEVHGNPFPTDIAAPIAAAASGTIPGLGTRFTASPAAAARPDTRLVVQFQPGDHVTAEQICGPLPLAPRPGPGQLVAFTVFCQGPRPVLSAMQWAPLPENANSPIIREMAEQAVLRMFVTNNDSVAPDDYWPD
jgi:hypothetical protein